MNKMKPIFSVFVTSSYWSSKTWKLMKKVIDYFHKCLFKFLKKSVKFQKCNKSFQSSDLYRLSDIDNCYIQRKLKYVLHCLHKLIDEDKRKLNVNEKVCIAIFFVRNPHVTFLVDSRSRLLTTGDNVFVEFLVIKKTLN